jgi:hypothetical protein
MLLSMIQIITLILGNTDGADADSRSIGVLPDFLEQTRADPAPGAFPSIGELLERCPGRDTIIHISISRVIDIAADGASP